ncbi:MAG: nickel-dependent lactate racemase [Thermoprotei archaeon]|nr:MAG: nickel-dependent lactate racemase [Thermoprotei archaeon]
MLIKVPFDLMRRSLSVEVPDKAFESFIKPANVDAVEELSYIRAKLRRELELRGGKRIERAAILIDDHTRPTPTNQLLPLIIEELQSLGVKDLDVILALGTHEAPPPEYLDMKIEPSLRSKVNFTLHNAYDKDLHRFVGITRFGTPLWLNKQFVEADFSIGVGSIFPSEVAGFTGGGKIVLPGIASYETINRNHSMTLSPKVDVGKLNDNVVRADIDDAAKIAGLDLIVDVVLDCKGSIVEAFVGDPIASHREGVKLCSRIYRVKRPRRRADIVIASPGGTEDIDFVQAIKALTVAKKLCKDDGVIILAAACPLGAQWPELEDYVARAREARYSREEVVLDVVKGRVEAVAGGMVYRLYDLFIEGRPRVVMVSRSEMADTCAKLGFTWHEDLQEAVDEELSRRRRPRVVVAPFAAYTWVY